MQLQLIRKVFTLAARASRPSARGSLPGTQAAHHKQMSVRELAGAEPVRSRPHCREDEGVRVGEAGPPLRTGIRGAHAFRPPAARAVPAVAELNSSTRAHDRRPGCPLLPLS